MKPIRIYLDEAKERGIAKNDSDIARQLEVTPQAVSKWRKGDDAPAEDTAARLAELLNKPEVMAECAAARAKTPEGRRMWERLAKIAAAAVVVVAVTPHNTYASASQYAPCIQGLTVFRTYINVREELLNALIRNASPATCFREKAGNSGRSEQVCDQRNTDRRDRERSPRREPAHVAVRNFHRLQGRQHAPVLHDGQRH